MATGIVSTAFEVTGFAPLSWALLAVALLGYAALVVLYVSRLVHYRAEFLADTADAGRAFGFFTFVAASDVLALRLALGGQIPLFTALATLAALAWVACSYVLVPRVVMRPVKGTVRQEVTGAWLIWVVATQSLALAAARGSELWPGGRGFLELSAVSLWSAGSCLYLLLMAILLARLLLVPTERQDLSPTYPSARTCHPPTGSTWGQLRSRSSQEPPSLLCRTLPAWSTWLVRRSPGSRSCSGPSAPGGSHCWWC
jgi:hypothetical protein